MQKIVSRGRDTSDRRPRGSERSGVVSRGLIFTVLGIGEMLFTFLIYLLMGRGDAIFGIFFLLVGLQGLGLALFGMFVMLREA